MSDSLNTHVKVDFQSCAASILFELYCHRVILLGGHHRHCLFLLTPQLKFFEANNFISIYFVLKKYSNNRGAAIIQFNITKLKQNKHQQYCHCTCSLHCWLHCPVWTTSFQEIYIIQAQNKRFKIVVNINL